jgi:hypothetical protein
LITVLRAHGLRVAIYRDDHEPPHVHVIGDVRARIVIAGPDGLPHVLSARGMKFGDLQKAIQAVAENQDMLL